MSFHPRLRRAAVAIAAAAAFALSAGPAAAAQGAGPEQRSDNAPGDGTVTQVDDRRPAGAGQGRKIG